MPSRKTAAFLSLFFLLLHNLNQSKYCTASDTITQSQKISVGDTLTSSDQNFELGFFSPENSSRQYVGIWYKKIPVRKAVWVANRENPIKASDRAASLAISQDGNLVILDGNQSTVWSSNISVVSANDSVAAFLQDNGDLVLKDVVSGVLLWESFRYPCDTIVPQMMMGMNKKTGETRFLTCWKAEDDPAPGNFVFGISGLQAFVWNGSAPYWRSGEWNGIKHIGIPLLDAREFLLGFGFDEDDQQGTQYYTFGASTTNSSLVRNVYLTPTGYLEVTEWGEGRGSWTAPWKMPESPCDVYGACGPFGVCNKYQSPICGCLRGFVPKSDDEWKRGNWTGGCVRRTELVCRRNFTNTSSSVAQEDDGFLRLSRMKLPDFAENLRFESEDNAGTCKRWCLNNCSCHAYAFVEGIRCMAWTRPFLDTQQFWADGYGEELFLRLPNSELGKNKRKKKLITGLLIASSIIFLGSTLYEIRRWKARQNGKRRDKMERFALAFSVISPRRLWESTLKPQDASEPPMFDFDEIEAATKNFSMHNKIGEGGFGPVYKGKLQNGQEIAVKRLSSQSGQGIEEFKNEIILISKLQHRNLVRLLGCCIEGEELLIVYEYMSNKSLDTFLFDGTKRPLLDWPKRFNIIQGIARGLLYLHRDSCLKIIHRDLKVSNILLDERLNPKISDFGLARTFRGTQELAKTHRVIGTFGYMSPEYVMRGTFSEKSDVFSFGVLLLEIISGKKNNSFLDHEAHLNLLDDAWHSWSENRGLDFMDQTLANSGSPIEVMRCLHVGLLCVQDYAMDRPTMSEIVFMLRSETDRPHPKQPTCTSHRSSCDHVKVQNQNILSTNEITISMIHGR